MRVRLAVLAAGAAVLLAACGGGGGNEGAASAGLTPAEFRQQADAVCAKFEQKLDALGAPSSLDDLSEFVDQAVGIIEEGNAEMATLEPPDELATDWNRAMELQNQNLAKVRELQQAIEDNDTGRTQQLFNELNETQDESTQLARKMGLEKCGEST